jgi:hypothetical protein
MTTSRAHHSSNAGIRHAARNVGFPNGNFARNVGLRPNQYQIATAPATAIATGMMRDAVLAADPDNPPPRQNDQRI